MINDQWIWCVLILHQRMNLPLKAKFDLFEQTLRYRKLHSCCSTSDKFRSSFLIVVKYLSHMTVLYTGTIQQILKTSFQSPEDDFPDHTCTYHSSFHTKTVYQPNAKVHKSRWQHCWVSLLLIIIIHNELRRISNENFSGKLFIFRRICAQIFRRPNEFKLSAQIFGAQINCAQYNGTQIFGN